MEYKKKKKRKKKYYLFCCFVSLLPLHELVNSA